MTDLSTNDVQGRTLTALFDTRDAAQKAFDDLVKAGIPREHLQLTEGTSTAGAADKTAAANTNRDSKGFWEELKDMFMPDEDRHGYAEGLQRGGHLLAVRADEANYTRVMDILDRDGAVDMDAREASWRASGWTGYQASTLQGNSTPRAAGTTSGALGAVGAATTQTTASSGRTSAVELLKDGGDASIPVYEERASVAKRDVDHGRVRLRSYVVKTPFSQDVSLRNEQVQVERHAVDRAVGANESPFKDRVIEAEEHSEEAVLSKEARVKEEVSLRKSVDSQTKTVTDTLRTTKVDIEDTRTGHGIASASGLVGGVDTTRIIEHMPVLDSTGTQIGTVDHLDGPDKIKLAKSTSADGQHHYVPLSWVDHVDTHVHLNKTGAQARAGW